MPAPTSFDLAKLDAWCGCRPGMTRAQVLAALAAAEVEAEAYGADQLTVTEDEWEMECCFAKDGSERLRQLSIDGAAISWAGHPLMDVSVDEALRAIAPPGPALWTAYDAAGSPFSDPSAVPAPPVTEVALLLEGTIWLPERGLGLVIYEGGIFGVVWRAAQDLPAHYAGPVTEAQRALSQRPDVKEFLRAQETRRAAAAIPKDPLRFLRGALTLATIAGLALTARDGIREMALWAHAPLVKAKLVAVERGPRKQFFEYLPKPVTRCLPRWLLAGKWSGPPLETDLYRMEYTDPRGQQREVRLESAEFYVPPRALGEEVELASVDEEPPRVKGPSRVHDGAFMEHVPWAICLGGLWLLGHGALSLVPGLLGRLRPVIRRLLASRKTFDPDRPELS
jgi:hypothetical protein